MERTISSLKCTTSIMGISFLTNPAEYNYTHNIDGISNQTLYYSNKSHYTNQ